MGTDTSNTSKLTNKAIRAWTYRGGWDVHWDRAVTGLGLRIYPSGKKSFVLSYRSGGRKRLMVLGTFGVITIDEARRQASKKLVSARDGDDPLDEKRRELEQLPPCECHALATLRARWMTTPK